MVEDTNINIDRSMRVGDIRHALCDLMRHAILETGHGNPYRGRVRIDAAYVDRDVRRLVGVRVLVSHVLDRHREVIVLVGGRINRKVGLDPTPVGCARVCVSSEVGHGHRAIDVALSEVLERALRLAIIIPLGRDLHGSVGIDRNQHLTRAVVRQIDRALHDAEEVSAREAGLVVSLTSVPYRLKRDGIVHARDTR